MRRTRLLLAAQSERGDTLIEVLIAVVIMALTAVALLGALTTAISASVEHRSLAVDDNLLRSFAETAKQQIELDPSSPQHFTPQATSYAVAYTVPPEDQPPTVPSPGYTIKITGIAYWSSAAQQFQSTYVNSRPDKGIQLITVTAMAPNQVTKSLSFVVRDTTYES